MLLNKETKPNQTKHLSLKIIKINSISFYKKKFSLIIE